MTRLRGILTSLAVLVEGAQGPLTECGREPPQEPGGAGPRPLGTQSMPCRV